MRSRLLAVMTVMLAAATALDAQAPTDFSGQWTVSVSAATPGAAKPGAKGDMGSGFGSPITISQDAKQLVIEQTLFSRYDLQPPVRYVYLLDGSESKNAIMIGHSTQVRTSRVMWDGPQLRIRTTYPAVDPASGKTFTTEVSYHLALSSPTTLVVAAARAGVLGGQPTVTQTVYQKSPGPP